MHSLETLTSMNAATQDRHTPHPLHLHPRIVELRKFVDALPVDGEYKLRLRRSIWRYADQFISRPIYAPEEGWSNEEALQQVTLGDWNEEMLQDICWKKGMSSVSEYTDNPVPGKGA